MAASTEFSSHPPLFGSSAIRLMQLAPGNGDDQICVSLVAVSSPDAVQYDALSYVWGDPTQKTHIVCNGERFSVTNNLFWALKRVRKPTEPRWIWADAVCINQLDITERSRQVAIMGSIYTGADIVYVCMGESPEEDDILVKGIIADALKYMNATISNNAVVPNDLRTDIGWYAISRLNRNPWFDRAWVVQEAGLARNPIVLYGKEEFGYRDLIAVLNWKIQFPWALLFGDESWLIHRQWTDWSKPPADPALTFLDLLSHSCYLQCSDDRDHIFAFLGHPTARGDDGSRLILEPDYTKDFSQICLEVTLACLQKYGLKVLSMIEHNEATIRSDEPSWTLRWDAFEVMNDIYCAGNDHKASSDLRAAFHREGRNLFIEGIIIDTVQHALPMSVVDQDVTFFSNNEPRSLSDVIESLVLRFGESALPSLFNTLLVGRSAFGNALQPAMILLARMLSTDWEGFASLSAQEREWAMACWEAVTAYAVGRSLLVTESGCIGLASKLVRPGDKCCIMLGAQVPCVIRPGDGGYRLLGEAYVHGFMQGEVRKRVEEGTMKIQSITLY